MTNTKTAIFWAVALFAIAFAARGGLFSTKAAGFLLLVLPIVAIVVMRGRSPREATCRSR